MGGKRDHVRRRIRLARRRGELLSWLMFVATGIGPYRGQAVYFKHFAPEPVPYAHARYQFEAERHLRVLDERLAGRDFIVGDAYTIGDMAVWGWTHGALHPRRRCLEEVPQLKRHFDAIGARLPAQKANTLKDRHAFKAEMDEEARRVMFRHLATKAA